MRRLLPCLLMLPAVFVVTTGVLVLILCERVIHFVNTGG